MADTSSETASVLNATSADNAATSGATNATMRVPATPEGMVVAYSSLVIMALLPIFIGSFRSVKHHKEQKVRSVKPLHLFFPPFRSFSVWKWDFLSLFVFFF